MTRDSWLFSWLALVITMAGYFAINGDPRAYTFQQWMGAVVAVGGPIMGKLGTSPLKGKDDASTIAVNRRDKEFA